MQDPLEQYLYQLAQSLKSLPAEQREAELREVRHHLESIVNQHMEHGESEATAVATAIRQFGSSQSHGRDLLDAWRSALMYEELRFLTFCVSIIHALLATVVAGAATFHLISKLGSPSSLPVQILALIFSAGAFAIASLFLPHLLRTAFFGVYASLMVVNIGSDLSHWGLLPSLYVSYGLEVGTFFLSGFALSIDRIRPKTLSLPVVPTISSSKENFT